MNNPGWKDLAGQVLRFGVVGGLTTILNYGVFYALYSFLLVPYLLASAIGFLAGVLAGFPLNSQWTFQQGDAKRLIPYFGVYLTSLLTGLGLLWVLSNLFGVDPRLGNLGTLCYTTVFNFLASRFLVFRREKGGSRSYPPGRS